MILELKNVTKRYSTGTKSQVEVLKKVDLGLKKGSIISIIGASGSGKSTIMHIAGGLDTPSSGDVLISGRSINKLSENSKSLLRLEKIGFIYQYHFLLPDFDVMENVLLPTKISKKDLADSKKHVINLLMELGLSERLSHYPDQLSGGEQQRVAIARAMINNPEIILADEPTGSLDNHNAQIVFELLKKQAKTRNCSTIIVTHNIDVAKKTDEIYEIKDGILKLCSDLKL